MVLTQEQIVYFVDAAWFNFIVEPRTVDLNGIGITGYFGNNFNMTGEGAVDLQKVQRNLVRWPRALLWLDVGQKGIERFILVRNDDVEAMKQAFITRYGLVVKPNYYDYDLGGVAQAGGPIPP